MGHAPLDFKTHRDTHNKFWGGLSFLIMTPTRQSGAQFVGSLLGNMAEPMFICSLGSAGTLKNDDLIKRNFKNQQKHYTAHRLQCGKLCSQLPEFFLF